MYYVNTRLYIVQIHPSQQGKHMPPLVQIITIVITIGTAIKEMLDKK